MRRANGQNEGDENEGFFDRLISEDTRRRTRDQTRPLIEALCTPACVKSAIIILSLSFLILGLALISLTALHYREQIPSQTPYISDSSFIAPDFFLDSVTDESIRTHIQYLSDDLLEGRGVGTRGEALATKYIATHFQMAGLKPGAGNDSYFQDVLLKGHTPIYTTPLTLSFGTSRQLQFQFLNDFTVGTDLYQTTVNITNAPIIFVGFGIVSPVFSWDDYKGVNVSGKIILALVNDPFEGETLTYYGRWTYKFEQARRMGALGAILIHTNSSAGYGWQVVRNSWGDGETASLRQVPINPLFYRGWITQSTAETLAYFSGTTFSQWISLANSPDFQPILLGATVSQSTQYLIREFDGINVIGMIEGENTDETMVVMGHHDHLGQEPGTGDTIYNGAVDNASGLGAVLSCAYALGRFYNKVDFPIIAPQIDFPSKPRRNIIFVTTTAEEQNLLGADFMIANPPTLQLRPTNIVAAVNFDVLNVYGKTSDIVIIGFGTSTLFDTIITSCSSSESLSITPDPTPGQGHFFRSDQLPLARVGIPAINPSTGTRFIGKSPSYYSQVTNDYNNNRYHQPSDEYDPSWDLSGAIQQVRMSLRLAYWVANSDYNPTYNPEQLID
eukprot:TRINITY_DN49_c0_g1_i1.p1 TRINITY_DN49_c0_g1~~TRINITY_DN49_c0_g1_i1.p1  ORF type:complete len:616 (-),score=108.92 TRINITY_DN49_c0_g1_i1:170-2017(-)